MPREIKVGLVLEADGKGFRGEVRVSEQALRKFTAGTRSAAKSARATAKSTRQLRDEVKTLGDTARQAHGKLAGYASLGIVFYRAARAISAVRLNPFSIRAWVQTQDGLVAERGGILQRGGHVRQLAGGDAGGVAGGSQAGFDLRHRLLLAHGRAAQRAEYPHGATDRGGAGGVAQDVAVGVQDGLAHAADVARRMRGAAREFVQRLLAHADLADESLGVRPQLHP